MLTKTAGAGRGRYSAAGAHEKQWSGWGVTQDDEVASDMGMPWPEPMRRRVREQLMELRVLGGEGGEGRTVGTVPGPAQSWAGRAAA